MLKQVLIVALIAFVPSEAHLKKLLLKKAIAKHFLPSSLTGTLPPVKNVLPFLGSVGGAGLGAIVGGGAGGSDVASAVVSDVASAGSEAIADSIADVSVDTSESSSSENSERDVADPPQSAEVPMMPMGVPSVPVTCTADKPCSLSYYYVPTYALYPFQSGYYYPYAYYSYYPYYPYPYPDYYSSSEHRSTSTSPPETTW